MHLPDKKFVHYLANKWARLVPNTSLVRCDNTRLTESEKHIEIAILGALDEYEEEAENMDRIINS